MLAEAVEQLVAGQAELRGEGLDLVRPERGTEILRRDRAVRSGADPGIGGLAMAALLQLLEQVIEAAAEHGAGCAAGKQAAQSALEQVVEPAAGHSTCA